MEINDELYIYIYIYICIYIWTAEWSTGQESLNFSILKNSGLNGIWILASLMTSLMLCAHNLRGNAYSCQISRDKAFSWIWWLPQTTRKFLLSTGRIWTNFTVSLFSQRYNKVLKGFTFWLLKESKALWKHLCWWIWPVVFARKSATNFCPYQVF